MAFLSLTPFGDAQGTGVETEYIAVRTGEPGTPGWSTHAITPRQDPLSIFTLTQIASPGYVDELSPDLTVGVFRAASALTDVPDVAHVQNLYVRRDLRAPGEGTWSLLTGCPACGGTPLTTLTGDPNDLPWAAGASADFRHVIFESALNLTGAGAGLKLYMSTNGAVRLIGLVPGGAATTCGGPDPACVLPTDGGGASIAGLGARARTTLPNVISDDGTRVNFAAPVDGSIINPNTSNIYQYDTHGTESAADDTTALVNASERTGGGSAGAVYQGASADGARVFFTSEGALTDDSPAGFAHLYMWRHQPNDEVEQLTVRGTGGTFTLTFGGETTAPLTVNASPAQVASALDALSSIGGAGGTVDVSGGPGDDAGTSPYLVRFGGALGSTDVPLMGVDGTSLTGSAPAAVVGPWVAGGGHLTLIDRDEESRDVPGRTQGVIGTSEDGTYVYFVANSQLVEGKPLIGLGRADIYVWHDGQIRFIGAFTGGGGSGNADWTLNIPAGNGIGLNWGDIPSRVTPDGRALLFRATDGSGLTGYNHAGCGTSRAAGCKELYVYRFDDGRLACVSCNLRGPATSDATSWVNNIVGASGGAHESHALSDDGRRVFFTSGDALVPEDTNGRQDAYEYDTLTGSVSLLSSGKSSADSYFMEASASGGDAFFVTRERLLGWDVDGAYDLYDAHVGGGFPEPVSPVPCSGSECQGPLGVPPAAVGAGSAGYTGSGNLHERTRNRATSGRRCKRGRVRRKVHGRVRCVRRAKAKHRLHHAVSRKRAGRSAR